MENIMISLEEYKELLVIKGKYEELSKLHSPLVYYDGNNVKNSNMPNLEPYKITIS
jgi:hypothetical protein